MSVGGVGVVGGGGRSRATGSVVTGLDLQFARRRYALNGPYRPTLPAAFSYSRSGAATARTAAGTFQTFAADAPRITDRGLLIEAARTNPLLNSGDASLWAGTNGSGLAKLTQTFAPFERCSVAFTNSENNRIRGAAIPIVNGTVYAVTLLFELGTSGQVRTFVDGTVSASATRGLDGVWTYITGTNGAFSDAVETVLAGAVRQVVLTFTAAASADVQFGTGSGGTAAGQTMFQHFAQFEAGSASSPILTAGTAVTRGEDEPRVTVPAGCSQYVLDYDGGQATGAVTPGASFDFSASAGGAWAGKAVTRLRMF